ncbi:hypothetical protein [Saccharopolyspora flava]|uniref:Uncharacterized protein n=1 Tax=Saccharopolyspora flava TaxID=95161 RepID=A0A1I6QHX1_9PSEU|nr:hypothetical protein [Saccharopolyspora flava]SFS52002.1 hypothetical protein SAMN05660874_01469 [Saccharopolyspora flava]
MTTAEESLPVGMQDVDAKYATNVGKVDNLVIGELGESLRRRLLRGLPKAELAESRLQWLESRFIEPDNFKEVWSKLQRARSVLVSGPAGAGRRSAAKMLLRRSPSSSSPIREVPVDTEEEEADFLKPETVLRGERLLVDLSADSELRRLDSAGRTLEAFLGAVEKAEGYAAVVLPPGAGDFLPVELSSQLVEIERPNTSDVLAQHLKDLCTALPQDVLDDEKVGEFLSTASMEEIGRLSEHCLRLCRQSPEQPVEVCLRTALQAVSKRDKTFERFVSTLSAPKRALLLSAGFLEGAHADVVGDSAEKLRAQAESPEGQLPVLSSAGLDSQLRELRLDLTESREVRFSTWSAEAVVNYFWHAFPRLRPVLLEWVGRCCTSSLLTNADRVQLVQQFAMVCRQGRHGADLCTLASWLLQLDARHQPPRVRDWAARILAEGLKEEPGALVIRRQIYEWVTSQSLSTDLADVLVFVCSNVLAETHPEQAMVRLRHLARHSHHRIARQASDALVDLVEDDRIFFDLLWRLPRVSRRADADAALFLRIADPGRLLCEPSVLGDGAVRDQLIENWVSVVGRPREFWEERACDWFGAHTRDPSAEALLDVLVGAAGAAGRVGRLFVVLRNWAADGDEDSAEERRRTQQLVRKKIDEVQVKRAEEAG